VHTSRFNLDKTCSYLDLDISGCFEKVEVETAYLYGRRVAIRSRAYACERGDGADSLDQALKTMALKRGVVFDYRLPIMDEHRAGDRTILATGFSRTTYQQLGIRHTFFNGYEARMPWSQGVTLTSFKDTYTHQDFAYMASKNGIAYTLLFSRNGVNENDLERYQSHLEQTTGLTFPDWNHAVGCVPVENHLYAGGRILAGTLSGMIDPFFLSGVVGAMVSGKIAAMAVVEPNNAVRAYRQFTKNFRMKRRLHQLMGCRFIPGSAKLTVIFMHTLFKDVGKI